MVRNRPRLSYANVTATLALFVALGGGAYAATQLPVNSVGTEQIQQEAVTSGKVRDFTLKAQDFKPGQIPAGPTGPEGPQGPQGIPGTAGGLSGLETVFTTSSFDSATTKEAEAPCPTGKKATGGGVLVSGASTAVPTQSAPGAAPNPTSWYGAAHEIIPTDAGWSVTVYAMCADVAG